MLAVKQPLKPACPRQARGQHEPKLENSTWLLCQEGLEVMLRGCRSSRGCWAQHMSRRVLRALGSGHTPLRAWGAASPAVPPASASAKHVLERSSLVPPHHTLHPFGFFPYRTALPGPLSHQSTLLFSAHPTVLLCAYGPHYPATFLEDFWINYRENAAHEEWFRNCMGLR